MSVYFSGNFKAKEDENVVTIEGWANKPVVDDVGDKMAFDKVDLGRFKKNPIMFFNHDRDLPIGKWVEWKVGDEGLWVKGVISKSKDTVISYIRDLVKEGILKTLSIGFDPKDMQFNRAENYNEIKEWRLNEVSIVTMPCNVEAEFSLAKALQEVKSYDEAKAMVLKALKEDEVDDKEPKEPVSEPNEELTPDEEKERQKNAFQDCVSAKIPVLIQEGRAQDEAVAIAMSMCRDEGKCSVELMTPEMFAFAKECAAGNKKPDEEMKNKEVAFPLPQPSDDPSNFGSPQLDLMKSQLALLGKISEQMGQINTLLIRLLEKESEMVEDENNVPPQGSQENPNGGEELAKIAVIKDKISAMAKELGL